MKRILIVALVALTAVMTTGVAPVAAYEGTTYEELIADPSLNDQHAVVIRLYAAVFGRTPDNDGVRFWLDQYDTGEWSTRRIANFFATGDEFIALYGAGTTNAEFVEAVYPNVLGRAPDTAGRSFWTDYLDEGNSRAEMILLISNAPEFINANPLPSDDPRPPAPVPVSVAEQIFDGFASGELVDRSMMAPGSKADLYWALQDNVIGIYGRAGYISKIPTLHGFIYRIRGGSVTTYSHAKYDAAGLLTDLRVNGRSVADRITLTTQPAGPAQVETSAVQYITSADTTLFAFEFTNVGTATASVFMDDVGYVDITGRQLSPTDSANGGEVPQGATVFMLAFFDGEPAVGGSVSIEILYDVPGGSDREDVVVAFNQ